MILQEEASEGIYRETAMSPSTQNHPDPQSNILPAGLAERDLLVQKLDSLSLLSGGVAHDFNNLLMTIMGNADLALAVAEGQSSEVTNYIEEIQGASKRAADLCHRLLTFSGRGRFPMSCIDVKPLIEQMACSLGQTVGDGIRLSYDLPDELPQIRGNADELSGLLKLLVRNAREAMPEGSTEGEIHLSLRTVTLDDPMLQAAVGAPLKTSGLYQLLEVADDGEGMDGATEVRMLDPFFTTRGGGRGLGLAYAFGTVRIHLGRIAVESQLGRGTRVLVFLPTLDSADVA